MATEDVQALQVRRRARLAEALVEFAARPGERGRGPNETLIRFAIETGVNIKYLRPMAEGELPIGRRSARSVEIILGKPTYWMDT